jgi:hypothetical protein
MEYANASWPPTLPRRRLPFTASCSSSTLDSVNLKCTILVLVWMPYKFSQSAKSKKPKSVKPMPTNGHVDNSRSNVNSRRSFEKRGEKYEGRKSEKLNTFSSQTFIPPAFLFFVSSLFFLPLFISSMTLLFSKS